MERQYWKGKTEDDEGHGGQAKELDFILKCNGEPLKDFFFVGE